MKKRILSLLLTLTTIVGIMPFSMITAFAADDLVWPCESTYYITCMYYYKTGAQHSTKYGYQTSMDIAGGGNILAVESGVVEVATNLGSTSFGKYVIIKHPSGNRSLYAHLDSYSVSVGQQVTKGQRIGVMGTTGNSSGVHLHFEYSGGDPWKMFYNAKYMDKISFEQNVRSNNATYNSDKTVVNVIDKYYYKSGGNYYYSHTHSYTSAVKYETEHPHKAYKECSCGAKQYTGANNTVATCPPCAFQETGIALNAKYTVSGSGSGYSSYNANLTDGVYNTELKYDNTWFAFYYNASAAANVVNAPNGIGSVVIDLGKYYNLSQVKMNMINDSASGVSAPKAINIYISENGTNFTKASSVESISKAEKTSYISAANVSGTARYVKVEFELASTFAFVNEIKVFGTEATDYHKHSFSSGTKYETEHPHKMYKECSCGEKEYTGQNYTVTSCPMCSFQEDGIAIDTKYDISGSGAGFSSYTANLTDGAFNTELKYDNSWFAFYYNEKAEQSVVNAPNGVGSVVIDLGKYYKLSQVKINMINDSAAAIAAPKAINIYISDNGTNFTKASSVESISKDEKTAYLCTANVSGTARYVKVEFELADTFAFLNEIKVFGTETDYIPDDDTTVNLSGDVNSDGTVDAVDYLLIKRSVLNTYALTDEQNAIADIDKDGDVDGIDYLFVKRIVLGTYVAD